MSVGSVTDTDNEEAADLYLTLAEEHLARGRDSAARLEIARAGQMLQRLGERQSTDHVALRFHRLAAAVCEGDGDFETAVEHDRRAFELASELERPETLVIQANLARSLYMYGDVRQAIGVLSLLARQALEHDDADMLSTVCARTATVFRDMGDYSKAATLYGRAASLRDQGEPMCRLPLVRYAATLVHLGRVGEAEQLLHELESDPVDVRRGYSRDTVAALIRGKLALGVGEPELALEHANIARERSLRDRCADLEALATFMIANALFRQGQWAQALEVLDSHGIASTPLPERRRVLELRSECCERLGNFEAALSCEHTIAALSRHCVMDWGELRFLESLVSADDHHDQDRTFQFRKENELADLRRRTDEVMNIVVHDVRGPLSNLSLMAQQCEVVPDLAPASRQALAYMYVAVEQLQLLTDEVALKAVLDGPIAPTVLQRVSVAAIVRDAVQLYLPAIASKKQHIEVDQGDDVAVESDRSMALFIVRSLLSNAVKFSPIGAALHVTVDPPSAGFISIRVGDSGPGFQLEELALIFRRYQRLSAKPTAGEPTTGLGLHLSKRAASLLNGHLSLRRAGPLTAEQRDDRFLPSPTTEFILTLPHMA